MSDALPFLLTAISAMAAGYALAVIALLSPVIARWWRVRRIIADISREIENG